LESHDGRSPARGFDSAYNYAYECFECGRDEYHRNIRFILDLCFPNATLEEQLRRSWITNSVLCSADVECGSVPARVIRECRQRYLMPALQLMPDALIAALGRKAEERLAGVNRRVIRAAHPSPPGCRFKRARPSWIALAEELHERRSA
jgi:hypothetical protein